MLNKSDRVISMSISYDTIIQDGGFRFNFGPFFTTGMRGGNVKNMKPLFCSRSN